VKRHGLQEMQEESVAPDSNPAPVTIPAECQLLNVAGYVGVNVDKSVMPVNCASRSEGNIWKWVMDTSVPYSAFNPVVQSREVIACAPVN
jgi:hypothetical protein